MIKAVGAIMLILLSALALRQGFTHRWRLAPVQGTQDCRTGEILDEGCSMFGACLKCGYACAEGTEAPGQTVARCR